MRDESSLRRQWLLLKTLSSRHYGLTVRQMATDMDVAEKTVRRDLAVFRGIGFPLEETVGDFGRKSWRIAASWNQPPLCFTFEEAVALYLGRRMLEPLAGTPVWDGAQRAFQKLRATFGQPVLEYVERFAGFFHQTGFDAHDYSRRAEVIDRLHVGMEDSKAVHVVYQSDKATEPACRDVYPYGVAYHRHALYLVAFAPQEDKIKHYKVDRIEAVEVSEFRFHRPKDFDLAAHLASSFGVYHSDGEVITVKVRFAPAVARYVQESSWHDSQRLTKQRDGSLLAEFRLSSTQELRGWVLSFGRKAVVLEPEELRREIAEELQALLTGYSALETRAQPPEIRDAGLPATAGAPVRANRSNR